MAGVWLNCMVTWVANHNHQPTSSWNVCPHCSETIGFMSISSWQITHGSSSSSLYNSAPEPLSDPRPTLSDPAAVKAQLLFNPGGTADCNGINKVC